MSFLSPSAHATSIVPAGFGVSAFEPGHSQRHQKWQHPVGDGRLCQAEWVGVIPLLCPMGLCLLWDGNHRIVPTRATKGSLLIPRDMWAVYRYSPLYRVAFLSFVFHSLKHLAKKIYWMLTVCWVQWWASGYFCLSLSSFQSGTGDKKYIIKKKV